MVRANQVEREEGVDAAADVPAPCLGVGIAAQLDIAQSAYAQSGSAKRRNSSRC